ncbi:antitoxin VapB family protein [Halapricum desulfuricans]|nr:antitoxin VapB family protein [Halapricum desulfuricans]
MATIEVSDAVYEILDEETGENESIDDLLVDLLGIEDEEPPKPDVSEVESGDIHGGDTNMWTVYDQLDRERAEGESLADTFRRIQG